MNNIRIKICGITRDQDAQAAVAAGAHALGFIFYPPSPRYIEPENVKDIVGRLPPFVTTVGVFVNQEVEQVRRFVRTSNVNLLQLHGEETPQECRAYGIPYIKGIRVSSVKGVEAASVPFFDARGFLLDTLVDDQYGGTGESFNWLPLPQSLDRPVILAGGLDTANVSEAIRTVRPYGVDVSTGVERSKGIKDPAKIKDFIEAVRNVESV